jgi:hypothetical protein
MKIIARFLMIGAFAIFLFGCSHTKTIFVVNYRNESYTVSTSESRGQSDFVAAKSGTTLTCDEYVGGSLTINLVSPKGIKETLVVDSTTMKSMTLKDSVVIIEIR